MKGYFIKQRRKDYYVEGPYEPPVLSLGEYEKKMKEQEEILRLENYQRFLERGFAFEKEDGTMVPMKNLCSVCGQSIQPFEIKCPLCFNGGE